MTLPVRERRWLAAATLLLTATVIAQTVWLPEERRAVAELRDETERAQRQSREWLARDASRRNETPGTPAEAFRARFPATADNPKRAAQLLALGQRHGLALQRADFGYSVEPALGIGRYRVALPISGSYRALRGFVGDALAADPALLLESLTVQRPDTRAPTVEAQLQFVMLSRAEGWVRPAANGSRTP
jgi:hypothetical protein